MSEYIGERRKYYRLNFELDVRYKFVSQVLQIQQNKFFEGKSNNISIGGILLKGVVPEISYISGLFLGEIRILLYIFLPLQDEPIKAIGELRHIEIVDKNIKLYTMGLEFIEITAENKNRLTEFIVSKI
jgi:c-di-GMP-binding flagellar brake protein YcgR